MADIPAQESARLPSPAASGAIACNALLIGKITATVEGILASIASDPTALAMIAQMKPGDQPSAKPMAQSGAWITAPRFSAIFHPASAASVVERQQRRLLDQFT